MGMCRFRASESYIPSRTRLSDGGGTGKLHQGRLIVDSAQKIHGFEIGGNQVGVWRGVS